MRFDTCRVGKSGFLVGLSHYRIGMEPTAFKVEGAAERWALLLGHTVLLSFPRRIVFGVFHVEVNR